MKYIFESLYKSGKAGLISLQANKMTGEEEKTFERYCVENAIEKIRNDFFYEEEIEIEARAKTFELLKNYLSPDDVDKFNEDELANKFQDEWSLAMQSYMDCFKSMRNKMIGK